MYFDPGLSIGNSVKNSDIINIFKCGDMGGMRRSHSTKILVIISDYTKGPCYDKWIEGTLHYTGMGKSGDQDINWAQNLTLAESNFNGVYVYLFEVMDPGSYIYCGRVVLVDKPYTEAQLGEDGKMRNVYMFPVKPTPDNDVIKPKMFVFKNMQDYISNGKNVDAEYEKTLRRSQQKSLGSKKASKGITGKEIAHKTYGKGTITKFDGIIITVKFEKKGIHTLNYQICMDKQLIEFL